MRLDIDSNPKKIKLVELDAAQLPHSLADVDAAAETRRARPPMPIHWPALGCTEKG